MAVVHPAVAAPEALFKHEGGDVAFSEFKDVITNKATTVSELFAVLRLWEPMIQEHIGAVAYEMLKRGATVNDKDGLTDMTLLHFAAKSGARGLGDQGKAASVARDLIRQGADVNVVCGWTNMTPLHYAAFFGSTSVLQVLATEGKNLDINAPCSELEGATPLHMAAMTGSPGAVETLLKHGADVFAVDRNGQTALECAMHVAAAPDNTTPQETWNHIIEQLSAAAKSQRRSSSGRRASSGRSSSGAVAMATTDSAPRTSMIPKATGATPKATPTRTSRTSRTDSTPTRKSTSSATTPSASTAVPSTPGATKTTTAMTPVARPSTSSTVNIGDRVEANGKTGLVRFKGPVQFNRSGHEWIGIQLDEPVGTHNGTVKGVEYFRCKPNCGLFVRPSLVTVIEAGAGDTMASGRGSISTPQSTRRSSGSMRGVEQSPARTSKTSMTPGSSSGAGFGLGSKVFCKGMMGTVKYIGPIGTKEGTFLGIEFSNKVGKNDGSLNGERYFSTDPDHGLFVKSDQATWRGIKCSLVLDQL